jgi:hypothetical protein
MLMQMIPSAEAIGQIDREASKARGARAFVTCVFTGRRVEEHYAVLPEPPKVLDQPDMNDELLMHGHATDVTA